MKKSMNGRKGLLLVSALLASASALGADIFEDPRGRFVMKQPGNWKCHDEGETARSKVICRSPAGGSTYVRVIAAAAPNTSLKKFASEQRGKLPSLKRRVKGSTWSVTTPTIGANTVVYLKSNVGLEVASIVANGWVYNVNFSYESPASGERDRSIFTGVVGSLVPLARQSDAADFDAGYAERQARLVELFLSAGDDASARQALSDGLEALPDDAALLRLKKSMGL